MSVRKENAVQPVWGGAKRCSAPRAAARAARRVRGERGGRCECVWARRVEGLHDGWKRTATVALRAPALAPSPRAGGVGGALRRPPLCLFGVGGGRIPRRRALRAPRAWRAGDGRGARPSRTMPPACARAAPAVCVAAALPRGRARARSHARTYMGGADPKEHRAGNSTTQYCYVSVLSVFGVYKLFAPRLGSSNGGGGSRRAAAGQQPRRQRQQRALRAAAAAAAQQAINPPLPASGWPNIALAALASPLINSPAPPSTARRGAFVLSSGLHRGSGARARRRAPPRIPKLFSGGPNPWVVRVALALKGVDLASPTCTAPASRPRACPRTARRRWSPSTPPRRRSCCARRAGARAWRRASRWCATWTACTGAACACSADPMPSPRRSRSRRSGASS